MSDGIQLTREIKVGSRTLTIEAFSTRRTTHVFKAVADLFKRYRNLEGDLRRARDTYIEDNPQDVTRVQCRYMIAQYDGLAAKAETDRERELYEGVKRRWEEILTLDLAERESFSMPPDNIPGEAIWIPVFPQALENAEEEVARLIGLVAFSNEEFGNKRKEARSEGVALADVLLEKGDEILDDSTPDEVLELLQVGSELFLGDMNARKERVGKIRAIYADVFQPAAQIVDDQPTSPTSDSTSGSEATSPSSTDSPADTDGQKTTSSTESRSVVPST